MTAPNAPNAASASAAASLGVDFEDRMATVEFRVGDRAHIIVDGDTCRGCTTRECVTACPANLFVPTADGGILFNYEQCFECGTCYMVCNQEGAISWTYPDGGHGVVFRRS
ncbi:MAG TPA: 4Fe-4S dicluster domain-containing protein [Acidimicrobiales bacterium]